MRTRLRVLAFPSTSTSTATATAIALALTLASCSADATTSAEVAAPEQSTAAPTQTSAVQTSAAEPASESRPTDDSMTLHPCLLTGDEVASVLGGNYDDGVLNMELSGFPNYICDYTNTDTGAATVAITAIMPRGFSAEQQRPGFDSTYDDAVDVTLTGSDYAFTADGGTIVAAQVGDYSVFVASNANGDSDPDGSTVRLAQIAVGNV
jgi:hypothetical protein